MNALDQLKMRVSKREAKLKRQKEEKEGEERGLQRVKKEAFRATVVIYIEPLALRPPPVFWKSSGSSREELDIEQEIFEALKCATIMGGLEETLQGLQRHCSSLTPAFVIINDFEEENLVEKKTTKVEEVE